MWDSLRHFAEECNGGKGQLDRDKIELRRKMDGPRPIPDKTQAQTTGGKYD